MSFVVGETIGPYQLVEQLGQGGMATVFKAYHAALDRYVAIKVLHPAFLEDVNFLARFQREARVVARLEHPNIVPIYDFSDHQGQPYLVMKFILGKTLKAVMSEKQMTIGEIQHIVQVVGDALAFAHQQDVLHRDIKPSNVLIADDGQIYLADFGLARIASGTSSSLTSDMMVGTPQYISPEQAMSKPNIDGRTDIYSFGVMLYEMALGRVPFSADTPFAVIHDHIYTPLPIPRQVNPNLPEGIERVLLKTLAKDPNDRYSTAAELVKAFNAATAGLDMNRVIPRSDMPPTAGPLLERPVQPAVPPETHTPLPRASDDTDVPAGRTGAVSSGVPPAAVAGGSTASRRSAAPGGSGGSSGSGGSQSTPVYHPPLPEEKKKAFFTPRRMGCCGGIILGVLVAGVILVLLYNSGQKLIAQRMQTAEASYVLVGESTVEVDSTQVSGVEATAEILTVGGELPHNVQQYLDDAIGAWQDEDMATALQLLDIVYKETQNNPIQIQQVMSYLEREDAWLLDAMYGFKNYEARPTAFSVDRTEKLRMILYAAAEDEQAGSIFKKNKSNQIFVVASLRSAMIYGSDPAAAQAEVASLLENSQFARRFPEILLLDAEIAIDEGDSARARDQIQVILSSNTMPDWIKTWASELQNDIP